ncbi:MAG: YdcF family protein [Candidatus Omnitrophica bacterium]|nr:YdcF family protein [Candidatus Omnitrophota bacterium]
MLRSLCPVLSGFLVMVAVGANNHSPLRNVHRQNNTPLSLSAPSPIDENDLSPNHRFSWREELSQHTLRLVSFLAEREPLPDQADLIMVLGSDDLQTAIEAARLYRNGLAPKILVSGGIGRLTPGLMEKFRDYLKNVGAHGHVPLQQIEETEDGQVAPEAVIYKKVLMLEGVPEKDILVEDQSTNTGENVRFSRALLENVGANNHSPLQIRSVILLQTPILQKRAKAIFLKQFGLPGVTVTSYAPYLPDVGAMNEEELIRTAELAVGEMQRLPKYAKPLEEGGPKGGPFNGPVPIPSSLLESQQRVTQALAIRSYSEKVYDWTMSIGAFPDGLEKIWRGFVRQEEGSWIPKRFEAGGILLTAYRFKRHDFLQNTREVFEPMVREIAAVFPGEENKVGVHWAAPGEDHLAVSVIQEDPEVLDEDQKEKFVRVNPEEVEAVGEALQEITRFQPVARLGLVGFAPAANGGMIALFRDRTGEFTALRETITKRANEVTGGKVVSRPKLINMTVGRILELPYSSDPATARDQKKRVLVIIQKYTQRLRDQWGLYSPSQDVVVDEITYGWDRQWNFYDFERIGDFPLLRQEDDKSGDFTVHRAL